MAIDFCFGIAVPGSEGGWGQRQSAHGMGGGLDRNFLGIFLQYCNTNDCIVNRNVVRFVVVLIIGIIILAYFFNPYRAEPGMKTFSNDTFAFEIQYPEDAFHVSELYSPKTTVTIGNYSRPSFRYKVTFLNTYMMADVDISYLDFDFDKFVQDIAAEGDSTIKDITIEGISAKKIVMRRGYLNGSKQLSHIVICFVKDSNRYVLTFISLDPSLEDSPVVNTMIKSFRFKGNSWYDDLIHPYTTPAQPTATKTTPLPTITPVILPGPMGQKVLDLHDLPESYEKEREEGGEFYHLVTFVKNESGIRVTEIGENIGIFSSEDVARDLSDEKKWMEDFVASNAKYNTTLEYLPNPRIGDSSQAFRINHGINEGPAGGKTQYEIDFSKKNVSVNLYMIGSKTDYQLLLELARRAAEKI